MECKACYLTGNVDGCRCGFCDKERCPKEDCRECGQLVDMDVKMRACPRVQEGTLKRPVKRCWCRRDGFCSGPPMVRYRARQKKGIRGMFRPVRCVIRS